MKKLILILSISFAIFGCSPNENIDISNKCNCGEIIQIIYVRYSNGQCLKNIKVKNNCSEKISVIETTGGNVGEQFCHE